MKTIHVVTDIQASPRTVWAELTAVDAYPRWNPFITSFEGNLVVGRRVTIRIAPPGGRPMTFKPTITDMADGTHLAWLGRLGVPGVFDGHHSFRLERLADEATRLTQTEDFSGVLVPLSRGLLERTRAGFQAMNEALRLRAEATTRSRAI